MVNEVNQKPKSLIATISSVETNPFFISVQPAPEPQLDVKQAATSLGNLLGSSAADAWVASLLAKQGPIAIESTYLQVSLPEQPAPAKPKKMLSRAERRRLGSKGKPPSKPAVPAINRQIFYQENYRLALSGAYPGMLLSSDFISLSMADILEPVIRSRPTRNFTIKINLPNGRKRAVMVKTAHGMTRITTSGFDRSEVRSYRLEVPAPDKDDEKIFLPGSDHEHNWYLVIYTEADLIRRIADFVPADFPAYSAVIKFVLFGIRHKPDYDVDHVIKTTVAHVLATFYLQSAQKLPKGPLAALPLGPLRTLLSQVSIDEKKRKAYHASLLHSVFNYCDSHTAEVTRRALQNPLQFLTTLRTKYVDGFASKYIPGNFINRETLLWEFFLDDTYQEAARLFLLRLKKPESPELQNALALMILACRHAISDPYIIHENLQDTMRQEIYAARTAQARDQVILSQAVTIGVLQIAHSPAEVIEFFEGTMQAREAISKRAQARVDGIIPPNFPFRAEIIAAYLDEMKSGQFDGTDSQFLLDQAIHHLVHSSTDLLALALPEVTAAIVNLAEGNMLRTINQKNFKEFLMNLLKTVDEGRIRFVLDPSWVHLKDFFEHPEYAHQLTELFYLELNSTEARQLQHHIERAGEPSARDILRLTLTANYQLYENQVQSALDFYKTVTRAHERRQEFYSAATIALLMSEEYENDGRTEQAAQWFETALELADNLYDPAAQIVLLTKLGLHAGHLGQFERGIALFNRALRFDKEDLDQDRQIELCRHKADFYAQLGDTVRAVRSYQQLVKILGGHHVKAAHILIKAGMTLLEDATQSEFQRHQKATDIFLQAAEMYQEGRDYDYEIGAQAAAWASVTEADQLQEKFNPQREMKKHSILLRLNACALYLKNRAQIFPEEKREDFLSLVDEALLRMERGISQLDPAEVNFIVAIKTNLAQLKERRQKWNPRFTIEAEIVVENWLAILSKLGQKIGYSHEAILNRWLEADLPKDYRLEKATAYLSQSWSRQTPKLLIDSWPKTLELLRLLKLTEAEIFVFHPDNPAFDALRPNAATMGTTAGGTVSVEKSFGVSPASRFSPPLTQNTRHLSGELRTPMIPPVIINVPREVVPPPVKPVTNVTRKFLQSARHHGTRGPTRFGVQRNITRRF